MVTPVTIERILRAACKCYGVRLCDIIEVAESERPRRNPNAKTKKRRQNKAAYAKQAVYYLTVRYLMYTPKLWKMLGDKDHTGISKAFKHVSLLRLVDRVTHFEIHNIEVELEMQSSASRLAIMMIEHEDLIKDLPAKEERETGIVRLVDDWLELVNLVRTDMRCYLKKEHDNHFQIPLFQ